MPDVAVEHGEPGERIVKSAMERSANLIVLGVRDAAGRLGAGAHVERARRTTKWSRMRCALFLRCVG